MGQRDRKRRAATKAIEDGLRELEHNAEMLAANNALRADWLRYTGPLYGNDICARCGAGLEIRTAYVHCARCLATRGIDEMALRRACAQIMEEDWPFRPRPLDARRWAHALIAFWREHVDPMESRAVPYRTNTLDSAFSYMQRHLAACQVAAVWTAPQDTSVTLDLAMVVRARGQQIAIGVGTQARIATAEDGTRGAPLASFDRFLGLAGEEEGVLVIEKLSRRARRDAPVTEIAATTAGGRRVTQLRCMQEDRFWIAAKAPGAPAGPAPAPLTPSLAGRSGRGTRH